MVASSTDSVAARLLRAGVAVTPAASNANPVRQRTMATRRGSRVQCDIKAVNGRVRLIETAAQFRPWRW